MAKTYTNAIISRDVSIAIEQLLVAPNGTSRPSLGRIDVATPPTGFLHLGGVVEDSPQLSITREKYRLETGIPRVLQMDAVIGMTGQFAISFYSNSNRLVRYALGGATPHNTFTTTDSAAGTPSRTSVEVSDGANFAAGDVIVTGADSAGCWTSENEAVVASVAASVLTLTAPGLPVTPGAGSFVAVVDNVKLAFGTSTLPYYYLIGVADFVDGVQIQHHFEKVSPVGEFTENIQPGSANIVSATWDMFAQDGGAEWGNEFILGDRVTIPKNIT